MDGDRPDRHGSRRCGSSCSRRRPSGSGRRGRNGGFCQASLTHGLANGLRHFPDEIDVLEREGIANLRDLIAFTRTHGIDCDLEETGGLAVADQAYQVEEFRAAVDESAAHGEELVFLDREAIQAEVHSPLWQAGLYQPPGRDVILDPAKLVRGLARVCEERGVVIHEGTRVRSVERRAGGVRLTTEPGRAWTRTTSSSRRRPTRAGSAGSRRTSSRSTTTSS